MKKSSRSLLIGMLHFVAKKVGRFEFYNVEIEVEIPVVGNSRFFDTVVLTSREKTVKLYFDRREHVWGLWAPSGFILSVQPSEDETHKKYLEVGYRHNRKVLNSFVKIIEQQRGNEVIRLHMNHSQLTAEPAAA